MSEQQTEIINSAESQIISNDFYCALCKYHCAKKSTFQKHQATNKHKQRELNKNVLQIDVFQCNKCGKSYKQYTSLCKHEQICNISNTDKLQKELLELQRQLIEFQKPLAQITELYNLLNNRESII